ncbi:unnamed protein product [Ilex paraguariensis]|uniref:Strictosidine synthase conserved region domain-containing protein n=1 Tax=Ilex paraguariensis TaxID=185542 RepID=A0ABC8RWY9_9AQUA
MADSSSKSSSSLSTNPSSTIVRTRTNSWPFTILLSLLVPVTIAVLVYQLDSFDPAPFPIHDLTHQKPMVVPRRNPRMLHGSEEIGVGQLLGPEDVAYDPKSGMIYTGCVDGWVKRVTVNQSAAETVVENWVNTGGRPLGIVLGHHDEVVIADADKGLLKVAEDGVTELLTDEAEGLKFRLTDAVDIANDGMMYFTDASYKYSFHEFVWDFFEGRPHGRLMRYDPTTQHTTVLVRDLYFANGVVISPDQNLVVFCETPMRRCKKYYLRGEREGSVDMFIDNLPGLPDNIRYDGEGHYWIAFSTEETYIWSVAQRYPFIRKVMAIMEKYVGRPHVEKNAGVLAVDLQGNPIAHYFDPRLSLISSGIKIKDHLYCGSIANSYILRLNLTRHPAVVGA